MKETSQQLWLFPGGQSSVSVFIDMWTSSTRIPLKRSQVYELELALAEEYSFPLPHCEACRLCGIGPGYLYWEHIIVSLSPVCYTPSVLPALALTALCVTKYQQNLRRSKHARVQL